MKGSPPAYRGRFAPSPTGALHFGSLVTALGSWLRARALGGTWLVRIEDIDPPREVPGAAEDILATLAAFGLESDEPVWFQSQRQDAYALAFSRLLDAGQAFPCRCSRSALAALRGVHPPSCVGTTSAGATAPAWRVRVADVVIGFTDLIQGPFQQRLARDVGPFVIKRVEGYFAYQLAVVVDDAAQGIGEIVRGADLLDATPRQIWLQRLLGYATPGYAHLPLALDASGRKLSKQERACAVDRRDPLPALRAALAFLGMDPARGGDGSVTRMLRRAIEDFDLTRIPRTSAAAVGS